MKKRIVFTLLIAVFAFTSMLSAGTHTLNNAIVHLQGDTAVGQTLWLESQVKIKFNHLKLGWDHSGKVDRIRYDISCLDGKVILQNVDYIDSAIDNREQVRWIQSNANLNRDFSFIKDDRDHRRDNNVKYSQKLSIPSANLDSAMVRFHFTAQGRHYIVIWHPRTNKLTTTWKQLN